MTVHARPRLVWIGLAVALPMASGCYLSHGLFDDGAGGSGGGRDAGTGSRDAGRRDAGAARDASGDPIGDAGPLVDDEPDVRPDERPSDDPGSMDWMDPPAPRDDSCCEVGEIVGIDDLTVQASPPVAAWDSDLHEWAVSWRVFESSMTTFRRLDATAHPTTGIRTLGTIGTPADLAWGNHRFALLSQGSHLTVLDHEGGIRAMTTIGGANGGGSVTRYASVHGWAVATYDDSGGGGSGSSRLVVLNDDLTELGSRDLGTTSYADWRSLWVVSLSSRVVVAQATEDGVRIRPFVGAALDESEGASFDPGMVFVDRGFTRSAAIGATRFRNHVVVVAFGGDTLLSTVFDPFTDRIVAGPTRTVPTAFYRSPGVAGDDSGGTIGVCYAYGETSHGDAPEIRFALLDRMGAVLGEPVTIARGLRYVAACTTAFSSRDEYVVVWWNAAREEPRHSISAAAVRVRR